MYESIKKSEDQLLMARAAWYYYFEDYTQQRISELMGISRAKVITLLERARQVGVVKFSLQADSSRRIGLERQVMSQYDLKDVFLTPPSRTLTNPRESVAQAAAMYIQRRLEPGGYINIGYGETTSRILNHLAATVEMPIHAVSLTGGVNYYLPNTRSNVFNARLHLAPTPLLLSTPEACESLYQEQGVVEITRMIPLSSMSVVGIGNMEDGATILQTGVLSRQEFDLLRMQGAVGDVLSHFIDKEGRPVSPDMEQRLVSTSLEKLSKLRNVIGVAAGPEKAEAVRAALLGGYLDVLITDEDLAEALIK